MKQKAPNAVSMSIELLQGRWPGRTLVRVIQVAPGLGGQALPSVEFRPFPKGQRPRGPGTDEGTSEGLGASEYGVRLRLAHAAKRTQAVTAGLLTLTVAVGACGSSPRGTVEGIFYGQAGGTPMRPVPMPSPGTIRAGGAAGVYFATAGAGGHFSLEVPPGTYLVSGRDVGVTGGISGCQAPVVRITSGKTTHIAVTCAFR